MVSGTGGLACACMRDIEQLPEEDKESDRLYLGPEVGTRDSWEQAEKDRESGQLHLMARGRQPGLEREVGSFFVR